MKNHLFLFTIGPVQTFISQARKTQDLAAGSRMLSVLCQTGIDKVKEKGAEIVFPVSGGRNHSLPNRFIARFPNTTEEEIHEIGACVQDTVKQEFEKTARKIAEENCIAKPLCGDFDKQIEDFLNIYCIAAEYGEDDYKEKYAMLETLMGAVKSARAFKQLGEAGRKCSLCGERNVLFCGKGQAAKFKHNPCVMETKKDRMNLGEGLCAVCFTKRFYPAADSFPSTAEVALMHLKDFSEFGYDAQLFYEENYTESYFTKQGYDYTELEKIKTKRNIVLEKNDDLKSYGLPKYYAVFAFDGDNMGKWLSGKLLKDARELEAFQHSFSEKLFKFAAHIKEDVIESKKLGVTVYNGGDDYLGFINLQYLFDVIKKIREDFKTTVNDPFKDIVVQEITFSAGITIAHYKTPLHVVLDWTRRMEKTAKELPGKDAFAIAVIKHSGDMIQTRWKWNSVHGVSNLELIDKIISEIQEKKFSTAFLSKIQEEFSALITRDNRIPNIEIVKVELKRLIGNACQIADKTKKKKEIEKYCQNIEPLLYESGENISQLFNLLSVVDFLIRKTSGGE